MRPRMLLPKLTMLLLPSALRSKSGTRVEAQMALIPIGRQLHQQQCPDSALRADLQIATPLPRREITERILRLLDKGKGGNVRAWLFYERCHLHHSERHDRLRRRGCRALA